MPENRTESDYTVTHVTEDYEQGTLRGVIVAAYACGAGDTWPDKGLGRAHAAAWRSRHQHTFPHADGGGES